MVESYRFEDLNHELYNLAFGDWDAVNHRINDLSITNNEDREKVLATVAATVIDFMEYHPFAMLIATGSTSSRTRLYQMGIANLWEEIDQLFEIHGLLLRWVAAL